MCKRGVLSAVIIAIFFCAAFVQAKPEPPPDLLGLLQETLEIEENLESGEWDKAAEAIAEVKAEFDELSEKLENTVESAKIEKTKNSLKALDKFISAKNEDKSMAAYNTVQKGLFDISEAFNYEIPPILLIMKKYLVEEAAEAAEEGNFDEVKSEMREVGAFYKSAREVLLEMGKPQEKIDALGDGIKQVVIAAGKGNKEEVNQVLQQTIELFKSLL